LTRAAGRDVMATDGKRETEMDKYDWMMAGLMAVMAVAIATGLAIGLTFAYNGVG